MKPGNTRIVFMGSPAFAVPSLEALVEAGYQVVAAVTQPDRPAGRGGVMRPPEVKQAATAHGIDVLQPETLKDTAARERLKDYSADVFVVAAYGRILARPVLGLPSRGCVNVHASLLPRWRGASPIASAILAGDAETGVSIMEMAPEMDTGPVIATAAEPIRPGDTTATLEDRLSRLGARTLIDVLPGWYRGEIRARPQDDAEASYCSLIRKEDGWLAASMTASEAERAVRAFNPWPGAYVLYKGHRLGIWRAHVEAGEGTPAIGTLLLVGRQPAIAFKDGLLVLDEVQRTGSRRQSGQDFVNGERGTPAMEVGLR
jgi:methionyl-tRNA formyltransferase